MLRILTTLMLSLILLGNTWSQSVNELMNLLVSHGTLSQEEADSLRAEAAIKQQETDANRKSFPMNAARSLQLSGVLQARYLVQQEKGKNDAFDIRRARLDLKGAFTPYFGYRMMLDFAASPKILDAYAEFKPYDFLVLTLGQTKLPFSLENLTSDNKLDLPDRSQVVEALVSRGKDVIGNHNGRDVGFLASGSLFKYQNRFLLDYSIGVFNGNGINPDTKLTDNNDNKDIAWRLGVHPIKGLDLGGSYYNGIANYGKKPKNYTRFRLGADLAYEYKRFSIKSEYIEGTDSSMLDKNGWYLQGAVYVIPQKVQLVLKYDTYDPNRDKTDNISTIYYLGVNYVINPWAKLQFSYGYRKEEGDPVNNNLAALQFQLTF